MTRTLTLFLIISNISGEAFMFSWLKGPRRSKSFLTWLQRPGWSSPGISEPFTCSSTSIFENFQVTCFDLTNFLIFILFFSLQIYQLIDSARSTKIELFLLCFDTLWNMISFFWGGGDFKANWYFLKYLHHKTDNFIKYANTCLTFVSLNFCNT